MKFIKELMVVLVTCNLLVYALLVYQLYYHDSFLALGVGSGGCSGAGSNYIHGNYTHW